jgi:hypothetical protein
MTTTRTSKAGALVKTLFTVAFISAVAAGAGFTLMRQDISRTRDEASTNAVTTLNHVLTPALRGAALDPDRARSAANTLRADVVGHAGISRVRLYEQGGKLLASTDPADRAGDSEAPVANALAVARGGRQITVVARGPDVSAVDGDPTLATFERAHQGRGGLVVAEIDQQLGPIDATGARRWRDPTRESEIAAILFLVLGLLGLLGLRARTAIRGRARPAVKLAPVASLTSAPRKTPSAALTADVPEEALGPPRARRASDGQVNRLQNELRGRDEEIRRLSDEMASLARDAQARIAELEDLVAQAKPTIVAPPVSIIGRGSAEAERVRAAAEQRAAEAEARAEAAEAAAAHAESRLREAQATADALRAELKTLSSTPDGRAPSLRDRLAEAAAKDDPSEHQASG